MACLVVVSPAQAQTIQFNLSWYFWGDSFVGNLTWSGNQGGISWDPDPASEDDRPADTRSWHDYYLDNQRASVGGPYERLPRTTVTFQAAPLPKALFLNVTRPIQLELYLKVAAYQYTDIIAGQANPCSRTDRWYIDPDMEIRLTMDGKIVAGLINSHNVEPFVGRSFTTFPAPDNPSGYSACRFAMAPETHVLPQGAQLRLEITFLRQSRPFPFGLADDHRSNIRFPIFPPDEVVFRYPELLQGSGDEEPLTDGSPLLAAAPLLLFVRMRRFVALVGITVLVALSGCLQGSTRDSDDTETLRGDATATHIRDFSNLTKSGRGSVLGVVFDESHIPIQGVRVAIIGTANSTRTDNHGRFQFLNLPPGPASLRFDKVGFQGFETIVEIKAGFLVKPSIKLYFSDPKLRDARPHDHDYWPGGEGPVEVASNVVACRNSCSSSGFSVPVKQDRVNTILPGTSMVEVFLDWDPGAARFARMGLGLLNNANANHSVYAPRGPKEPFLVATTWEMTDVGHQRYSLWKFIPHPADPYQRSTVDNNAATGNTPSFEVTARVRIIKGALPLEIPHPDFWGEKTQIEILKDQTATWRTCNLPASVRQYYGSCSEPRYSADWSVRKVIPYNTQKVEVTVKFGRSVGFTPQLLYKGAELPPRSSTATNFAEFTEAGSGTGSGTTFKWVIPVTEERADPPYARSSSWSIAVRAPNDDDGWNDWASNQGLNSGVNPTLTVVAHRNA